MVDVSIATGEAQPINRTGAEASEAVEEGLVVGLTDEGDGTVVVEADATEGQPAAGVAFGPVADVDALTDQLDNLARDMTIANQTTIGDRIAFIRYGVEVEDTDGEWDFDVNEVVYLGEDGGFTQTAPSETDDVVQVLGVAVEPNRVFVDVEADYDVAE